jgi:hypothetical protein
LLPEVKEWVDAEDDYDSEYERRLQKIRDDNLVPRWSNSWTTEERSAWYEADAKQKTAEVEFDHYKRERRMVALDKLKNSDDKLINWLMNHRGINRDYTSYRNAVLKALPMSREEMEGFGDRQGWCEEYTELLASAQAAGVLPEPVPPLANINELVRELREVVGGRERRMRSVINKHLPAILESARQIAVENAVKAEAEAEAARANDTTSGNTKRATTATGRTRTATVAA